LNATLLSFLIVAAGGAVGAMSRFGMTMLTLRISDQLPVGTLLSNLLGCFVMGIVVQLLARIPWFAEGGLITDHLRLLFAVGFCGAFTTLSSLIVEMSTVLQRDQAGLAFGYLVMTVAGGFVCFYAGAYLLRAVTPGPAAW